MSGAPPPPPNYSSPPMGQYAPPPEKSGYPQQQQFSPPPQQQQYPPPPTPGQFAPPPGQPGQPGQQQQQYYPPPQQAPQPQQQQYAPPPQSPGQFSPPPPMGFQPPPQGPPQGPPMMQTNSGAPASTVSDTIGAFNGGGYRIDHRDCNTLLTINLGANVMFTAKPGAMVGMSPTVTLKGSVKFSLRKMLAGGDIAQSTYTGPGEVLIAPPALGDIVPIRLDGNQTWSVGKDAFLACTDGVKKDLKSQGFGKAMFSGEGLFVYKVSGMGVLFITSLGAIIQKNMGARDEYIVDNDHLVAWNCKYSIERVASGGMLSGMAAAEGVVCRFTGPGTVFIQTRNPTAFGQWIASHMQGGQ